MRLRALLLVLLGGLFILGVPGEHRSQDPMQVDLSTIVESPNAWDHLLSRSAEVPIHARVSGSPAPLRLEPPTRFRVGRPSSLGVALGASEADLRLMTLTGPAGLADSLALGSDDGAFLIEPRESGPASWHLAVSSVGEEAFPVPIEAEVGGWVEEAGALRVLVLSGPPSSEARLAIRALEEAGEDVEAWIHLGRELWVGRGRDPGPLPSVESELAGYDLIIVFPGVEVAGVLRDGLEGAVRQRGVGLLMAGGAGMEEATAEWLTVQMEIEGQSPISGAPPEAESLAGGDEVQWRLPPEIPPLPARDVTSPLRLPAFPEDGVWTPPLTLGSLGVGRVAVLHLTESWRWRMEGDAVEGHRSFWRGMADWLTGGGGQDPAIEVLGEDVRVGEAVRLRVLTVDGGRVPVQLRVLTEEEGAFLDHRLPPPLQIGGLHLQEIHLVALEPGVYRLQGVDEADNPINPGVGVVIRETGVHGPDPEGRLARLAIASPGGGVTVGDTILDPVRGGWPFAFIVFLVLFGVAAGEWILRRWAGRP